MANTHSLKTPAASSTQTAPQPSQTAIPPPQTFDILPHLHEILARLDHQPTDPINAAPQETDSASYQDIKSLEPKDLPSEVNPVQSKIRKAVRELEKLPDMDRSVEEQDDEIRRLVQKEVKQREVLMRLGKVAKDLGEDMKK